MHLDRASRAPIARSTAGLAREEIAASPSIDALAARSAEHALAGARCAHTTKRRRPASALPGRDIERGDDDVDARSIAEALPRARGGEAVRSARLGGGAVLATAAGGVT